MTTGKFVQEVSSGDIRRGLEALRDHLATELASKSGNGVAALARVLLEVLRDLGRLPAEKSGRTLEDELNDRRAARLTARGEVPVQRFGGREKEEFPRQKGKPS